MDKVELIKLYKGLRVTDVCDGLDAVGLIDTCTMDWQIRPLWRDMDVFAHRVYGFAHTLRFAPTNRVAPRPQPVEEYLEWKSKWYGELAPGPKLPLFPDDILVIDGGEVHDTGFIGSNNAQAWINDGVRGIVTNGGCRDTDELIKQKVPVYHRKFSRGIRPGRLEYDTEQVPIAVGGVRVFPGDLVVADGDGVIVVPIEHAVTVAMVAREIANGDKAGRKNLYAKAGLPMDDTIEAL
jgi:4-hydroxy-4-methyl-2-oxoglutarate aldolase